jgi:3',5'-cyclic AMP phosphodiesterase CpdA
MLLNQRKLELNVHKAAVSHQNISRKEKKQLTASASTTMDVVLAAVGFLSLIQGAAGQTVIAQISDIHMCSSNAPHAATNLSNTIKMINKRTVNAVVVSGDIGEYKACWLKVRSILAALRAPVYYVPGNHDVHTKDVSIYRSVFGPDYYRVRIKNVDIIAIDSQLLGNFDSYYAVAPPPLPAYTLALSNQMFAWLNSLVATEKQAIATGHLVIALQHIPAYRDSGFPPDTKPYWIINDPYRTKEINMLHSLGVKDVLCGHWHYGKVFDAGNITWRSSPSAGWLPWGGALGFAVHTISAAGNVSTDFVDLPNAVP